MAIYEKIYSEKFYRLDSFRKDPLLSAAEKASLLFAEELTNDKIFSTETFETVKSIFQKERL